MLKLSTVDPLGHRQVRERRNCCNKAIVQVCMIVNFHNSCIMITQDMQVATICIHASALPILQYTYTYDHQPPVLLFGAVIQLLPLYIVSRHIRTHANDAIHIIAVVATRLLSLYPAVIIPAT